MNLSKSYEFFKPEDCGDRIHIIGCGAVGSTLAENIARLGITKISLYDFDKVEAHNIANQMFTEEDIGKLKTEAVKEMLVKINPEIEADIKLYNEGWKPGMRMSGYVFLCVDNIDLRREIAKSNQGNLSIKAMFDYRMRLTDAQHFASDWHDPQKVKNFLATMAFSHDEAKEETPVSACNMTLSVAPTVRMIVAAGVANFMNFVKTKTMKNMIVLDAFSFVTDAF